MTSERDSYAGAVAAIILDQQRLLLNTNAVAATLLAERDGIYLRGRELCLASAAELARGVLKSVATLA